MLLLAKLKFNRAVKIRTADIFEKESVGIIHSDTLFSGIFNEWVRVSNDKSISSLISDMQQNPPCLTISSAFPYYLDEYYLPTPYGTGTLYAEKLKEIPFLELSDFNNLARGNQERIANKDIINPLPRLINGFISPRVTIDRITKSTNIFEEKGTTIKEGGGLYFLINLKDTTLREKLELCIRLLGESGIGGDRSIGYGHYTAEFKQVDDLTTWTELFETKIADDKYYYTLSLCCPKETEAQHALSYSILSRGGWIFSNSSIKQMKRRKCHMFSEGSLFRQSILGQLLDVTPKDFIEEHKVFRNGLGMMIELAEKTD